MMGYQDPPRENMFLYHVYLENRIRKDHPLRRIRELIDLDFLYDEVKDTYGEKGNVSVPPPVIVKLMLLLIFYNVRSERELMETLPERLDWLWFLGYTLDSPIPDHSVLSKARKRWGMELFKDLFERIVLRCVDAGLVDGTKIFMDGSLIDADASNNSIIDRYSLKRYLDTGYTELEKRLDESDKDSPVNERFISSTDPDASIVRSGKGKAKLRYKTHRVVDGHREIITAVTVTPGAVDEGHRMSSLIEQHENNTGARVDTVIADSQYGTKENLLICHDKEIKAHMPVVKGLYEDSGSRQGIYKEDQFIYDSETDAFTCPAGCLLKKRTHHTNVQNIEYAASKKDCASCAQRPACTRSKGPRSLQRHIRHEEIRHMCALAKTSHAKRDMKTRKHLMERSFARSTRFSFDRCRWRGLWKAAIQEYLVVSVQNIQTLIRHIKDPLRGANSHPCNSARCSLPVSLQNVLPSWMKSAVDYLMCAMYPSGRPV